MLDTRLRGFAYDTTGGGTSLVPPLSVSSGGTGTIITGSATTLVGVNSSGVVYDYYLLRGSDNATVTRLGTAYFISATTNAGFVSPLAINSGGTGQTSHTQNGIIYGL